MAFNSTCARLCNLRAISMFISANDVTLSMFQDKRALRIAVPYSAFCLAQKKALHARDYGSVVRVYRCACATQVVCSPSLQHVSSAAGKLHPRCAS